MNQKTNIVRGGRGNRGVRGSRGQRGFTLIEILIVVIILGILAAIVVPQFSTASADARKGNVVTQVQMLSQQIALYKVQHNDNLPDFATNGWNQLTQATDSTGSLSGTGCGPYLQTAPINPLVATSVGSAVGSTLVSTNGWVVNAAGRVFAVNGDASGVIDETGTTLATVP